MYNSDRSEYTILSDSPLSQCDSDARGNSDSDSWEAHPLYGVLHSSEADCSTCNIFVAHIREYKSSPTIGFERALNEYHSRSDRDYFEGVAEGRQLEKAERGCPEECNCRTKLRLIEQVLRGDFSVAQDSQASNFAKSSGVSKHADEVGDSIVLAAEQQDSKLQAQLKPEVSTSNQTLPPGGSSLTAIPSYALVAGSTPASNGVVVPAANSSIRRPPASLPSRPPVTPTTAATTQGPTYSVPSAYYDTYLFHPGVEQHLNLLFRAAHGGDERALLKVKQLCTEAHATPSEHKTFGMRFVLSRWRNPAALAQAQAQQAYNRNQRGRPASLYSGSTGIVNPRSDDPPEVWWEYLRVYKSSPWPRGVRADPNGDPNLSDVKAHRIFQRVRPANCASTVRTEFTLSMLAIFTTPGRYAQLISDLGLTITVPPSYVAYHPTTPSTITEEDVARHYAYCGITISEAENEIAPWATEYGSGPKHT